MKTSKTRNPLGTYPKQFQGHLEHQFYRPFTIAEYDRCLAGMNSKMVELRVNLGNVDEDTGVDLIAKSDLPSYRAKDNRFMVRSFVRFLVSLGVAKPTPEPVPADTELERLKLAYEEYLRRQRGLSEWTIFHSWRIADRFLTFRFGEDLGNLSEITAADLAAFLQQAMTRTPPLRDKTLSSHLRNFFRYLFKGRKDYNQSRGGHPERCATVRCEIAPAPHPCASGYTSHSDSNRYFVRPAQLRDGALDRASWTARPGSNRHPDRRY